MCVFVCFVCLLGGERVVVVVIHVQVGQAALMNSSVCANLRQIASLAQQDHPLAPIGTHRLTTTTISESTSSSIPPGVRQLASGEWSSMMCVTWGVVCTCVRVYVSRVYVCVVGGGGVRGHVADFLVLVYLHGKIFIFKLDKAQGTL